MRTALMFALMTLAVPDRPDPTPKTNVPSTALHQLIQGEWDTIERSFEGRPSKLGKSGAIFQGDDMHLGFGRPGANAFAYGFKIDTSRNPAGFDIIYKKTKAPGKVLYGIIKIEGDRLTLCYALRGGERPTDFRSGPDSKTALWIMKRIEKK